MCGMKPCEPMHDGCTWSEAHRMACLVRSEAKRLANLSRIDRAAALSDLRDFDAKHGAKHGADLRAAIRMIRSGVSAS